MKRVVSEQLLDLLKLGLLALLYLFFIRVIWAVWTELRTPVIEPRTVADRGVATVVAGEKRGGGRRRSGHSAGPSLLRVIEPHDSAGTSYPLAPEMTLGRAPGCVVVVDDTYVSQLHARVFADDDRYRVEDLGSTNGTFLNGNGVSAPEVLALGDRIRVGNMVLEVA